MCLCSLALLLSRLDCHPAATAIVELSAGRRRHLRDGAIVDVSVGAEARRHLVPIVASVAFPAPSSLRAVVVAVCDVLLREGDGCGHGRGLVGVDLDGGRGRAEGDGRRPGRAQHRERATGFAAGRGRVVAGLGRAPFATWKKESLREIRNDVYFDEQMRRTQWALT